MRYIIEHLDTELYDWSLLEYTHLSEIVGEKNIIFTNIKKSTDREKLLTFGTVEEKSVKELIPPLGQKNICILDPHAEKTLTTADCKQFAYLVFGGILGDWPPQKRTQKTLSEPLHCETRNLGNKQMSTDTAVYVAKQITDGKKLSDLEFLDELAIPVDEGEEIILPFRFVMEHGKPVLAKGYIEFVKKQEMF